MIATSLAAVCPETWRKVILTSRIFFFFAQKSANIRFIVLDVRNEICREQEGIHIVILNSNSQRYTREMERNTFRKQKQKQEPGTAILKNEQEIEVFQK